MKGIVLVTGGAGFIGANLVDRLARDGQRVRVLDNLSRPHVERNLVWLKERHGAAVEVAFGDLRDGHVLEAAMTGVSEVFHLAAQVAVTTSLAAPREDFEVNAGGTLRLLEVARAQRHPPSIVYTSTNKVYGALAEVPLAPRGDRHEPRDAGLAARGVPETRPLTFQSPYGCSKGCADQYTLDYARSFGLATVVFRMSCIYGPRQFGTEDQGWVTHFMRCAARGEPIVIYGDGRQVRDLLYIDDLVDALLAAQAGAERLAGSAFNIGGGPENTLSLLELLTHIARLDERPPRVTHAGWRTADQLWYVSDTRRFQEAARLPGWPKVGVSEGLARLWRWVGELEREAVTETLPALQTEAL
jgi:CDP-paratose 2-epimerase